MCWSILDRRIMESDQFEGGGNNQGPQKRVWSPLFGGFTTPLTAGTVHRDADVKPEGTTAVFDQYSKELLGFHENDPDHPASPTSPMAIFGDHTCKMLLLNEPFSVGPNVVPFVAKSDFPTSYVFYAVNSLIQTQKYKRHWIPLNAKEIIIADRATAHRFSSIIQPMFVAQDTLRKRVAISARCVICSCHVCNRGI